MGFKIINSREYREMCERAAFLQSDIDEKNRELEVKEEAMKKLKKQIVQLQGCLEETKTALKDVKDNYDALFNEFNELKAAKPEVISFESDANEPVPVAAVSKPRRGRKPRVKKDSK